MSTLEALKAARALIATESTWVQFSSAEDDAGEEVPPSSPFAVCFCSAGAIDRATKPGWVKESVLKALDDTVRKLQYNHCEDISQYNDTHSHTEVLAVWDATIERLEKAQ